MVLLCFCLRPAGRHPHGHRREKIVVEIITNVNSAINSFVWGIPCLILLIGTGALMTILTKCFHVTHFKHWVKYSIGSVFDKKVSSHTDDKGAISQFQSLCTALAATVGTGNIAGVASAIVAGGPGAVFWMWFAAFFGMMTNYSENVLGIYYRRRNVDGEWSGGAMYYLQDGLANYKLKDAHGDVGSFKVLGSVLAVLFSAFAVLASFGIGNMTQIHTIADNLNDTFSVPYIVSGIFLMILAGLVVLGGIKRIASVTEKIVPIMVLFYVIACIVIIITNFSMIGSAFAAIFQYAFGIKAVAGGAIGVAVKNAVTYGFKRGVFSNEAGLGSSVMVHSNSNVKEPVRQGMWGIFEVFADTIIVCTLTALVILTSGLIDLGTGTLVDSEMSSSVLVSNAFYNHFGAIGSGIVAIALLLLAFSTCLGWSHYGAKSWEYLIGRLTKSMEKGTKSVIIYKVVFVVFILVGATMSLDLAWDISDTFNGLMAIPNLIGVLFLSPVVVKITKNYINRTFHGSDEKPMYSAIEDVQATQEAEEE